MFSGIGGFELGIQNAYEDKKNREATFPKDNLRLERDKSDSEGGLWRCCSCVGYSEIDKYAIQIYQKHFPTHKNYGDATKIISNELPDFDFLVGGFPCQAFSIAGKRKGLDDARGTLFFEIARILADKRPRNFVLENVKGLLSHDRGKTFQTMLGILTDLGYFVEWQVLNSKNFGVPQNRERVFFVGHLGRESRPKVFPIGEANTSINKTKKFPEQITNTLRTNYSNGKSNETYIQELEYVGAIMSEKNKKWFENGKEFSRNFPQGQRVYSAQRLEARNDNLMNNLSSVSKDGMLTDGMKIRRLTPIECERLQGFPDNWTAGISDTQRYNCLGNAVTVNVIKEIINFIDLE